MLMTTASVSMREGEVMLSAAFLSDGPVKNGLSALTGILGTLLVFKFFMQWIGPNEAAYRTRNQQPVLCHGYWKLTRYGAMYIATEPHYRTYGKGFQLKLPFIYDLQLVSVAEMTHPIETFAVDSMDDVQYDASPSVTYQVICEAESMFRAVEKSLTRDVAVLKIVEEAIGVVLHASLSQQGQLGSKELTRRVRQITRKELRTYGVRLNRINLAPCAKSLPEKLKGQSAKVAGIIGTHGDLRHPHDIPA
jgi:hypothetical protein